MKLKTIFNFLIFAAFLLTSSSFFSCSSPTGPGGDTPGRRDYIWTVDTLYSPMNDLQSIWGSSPTDVWTVGPGGDADRRLFHFDGAEWKSWPIACNGRTLFGFGQDNVWMGGADGTVWHFNGTTWQRSYLYTPANVYAVNIADIWGSAPDDVYAVGGIFYDSQNTQRGFILHYDGIKWHELFRADFYSQFQRIRKEGNKIYVQAIKIGYTVSDTTEIYQLTGNSLSKMYSESRAKIYAANLNMIGDKVYFTIGRDIFQFITNSFGIKKFDKILSIPNSNFDYLVTGRNRNDIFLFMQDGIAHYDGTDIKYLYRLTAYSKLWAGHILFKDQVYFNVYNLANKGNYILKGKIE